VLGTFSVWQYLLLGLGIDFGILEHRMKCLAGELVDLGEEGALVGSIQHINCGTIIYQLCRSFFIARPDIPANSRC
jgi:hypothetical protein